MVCRKTVDSVLLIFLFPPTELTLTFSPKMEIDIEINLCKGRSGVTINFNFCGYGYRCVVFDDHVNGSGERNSSTILRWK